MGPPRLPAAPAGAAGDDLELQRVLDGERESLLPASAPPSDGAHPHGHAVEVGDVAWWRRPLAVTAAKNLGLILLWYFFGTFLSLWNKLLVGKEHGLFGKGAFPAPFFMTSVQFFCQHLLARGLLASGLAARRAEEPVSWRQYARTILPNGLATGLDIGLSNYSLVFITLSFYVMCKSTTPLFLLSFAILWGIEKCAPRAARGGQPCPSPLQRAWCPLWVCWC
jgi:solute carrier family 35 protein C2